MVRHKNLQVRRRAATRRAIAAIVALGLGAAGCKGVLDVDLPGNVIESALEDPSLAPTLVSSAQGDFECALAVHILSMSVWTHDLIDSSTWQPAGAWNTRRDEGAGGTCPTVLFRGNGTWGAYLKFHISRTQAANAFRIISGHPDNLPNKQRLLATAKAYEGYSLVQLGEAYCDLHIDGVAASRNDAFTQAAAAFQKSMEVAQAANVTDILNLARVGRARALLNLGQRAAAKPFAEAVPSGFVYNATYAASPERRINWVSAYNATNLFVSVGPAYRNVMLDGVVDARVKVQDMTRTTSNDAITPMWFQLMYPTLGSPIPFATYQEAQLIVAEAEADANNVTAAAAAINRVRALYNLPTYSAGTATGAQVRTQVVEERRRTLFLQGHRLGDMLRYNLPFDQGLDHKNRAIVNANTCIKNPELLG
jgi:hypothetical protein